MSNWGVGLASIGCGYSGPSEVIEIDFDDGAPVLNVSFRDEAFIKEITDIIRSGSDSFLFVCVKHALVPLGH